MGERLRIMVSMNQLSTKQRAQVISCLVEGNSIRATVRITGVAKNTIVKLLADVGAACSKYQDETLRDITCPVIECDEIWSFCYSKQKNVPEESKGTFGYGDVWTWTAIDADTKLVPSWLVGERTSKDAYYFLSDLKSRLRNTRVQITTDGHLPYLKVIEPLFGADNVDFAMLHKIYGAPVEKSPDRKYSPDLCTGIDIRVIAGNPEMGRVSTSYVERQNLTMRMGMRRFTRLTNGFSKKVENLAHAVSLHYMNYNFARPHQTLTKQYGRPTTPAMAAGKADHVWSTWEIAELLQTQ
jgi:IS1 family transposase